MRVALPIVMTAIPSATLVVRTSAFIGFSFFFLMSHLHGHFRSKKLVVAPRFWDHLKKHSLAKPGVKRSLSRRLSSSIAIPVSALTVAQWIIIRHGLFMR